MPHHHEVCVSQAAKNRAASPRLSLHPACWREGSTHSLKFGWALRAASVKGSHRLKHTGLYLSCSRQTKKIHSPSDAFTRMDQRLPLESVASLWPSSGEMNTSCQGTPCSQPLWAVWKQPGLIATYLLVFWGLLHQKQTKALPRLPACEPKGGDVCPPGVVALAGQAALAGPGWVLGVTVSLVLHQGTMRTFRQTCCTSSPLGHPRLFPFKGNVSIMLIF